MRAFLAWFNSRRRLVALALTGLVLVVYLSAGRTPQSGEWVRIPDLGGLLIVVLGIFAVSTIVLTGIIRPRFGRRRPGEVRSIRTVVVLTLIIAAALAWSSQSEPVEEAVILELEDSAPETGSEAAGETDADTGASGSDIAALALILLIVAVVVARRLGSSPSSPVESHAESDLMPNRELAPAIEEAHAHLSHETDPRTAVLLAYYSLEHALAERGRERPPAETPSEHMARVLVDLPVLAAPAVRLGELYELARFSGKEVTDDERRDARRALDRARNSLPVAEVGRL